MDEPFFPAPRAKQQGYREPARALEAGEGRGSAPSDATASGAEPPKRLVVKRPDNDPRYVDGPRTKLIDTLESERTFGDRPFSFLGGSFTATYPRSVGAALTFLGGVILFTSIQTLRHGGSLYGVKSTMVLPMLLCWGLFMLIAGRPKDVRGRTPSWWGAAAFVVTLLGTVGGVALLAHMLTLRPL